MSGRRRITSAEIPLYATDAQIGAAVLGPGRLSDYAIDPRVARQRVEAASGLGFVYAIAEQETSHIAASRIKIGVSRNPRSRLSDLQTSNASRLFLIAMQASQEPWRAETILHNALQPFRLAGEWFSIRGEVAIDLVQYVGEHLTLDDFCLNAIAYQTEEQVLDTTWRDSDGHEFRTAKRCRDDLWLNLHWLDAARAERFDPAKADEPRQAAIWRKRKR